MSDHGAPIQVLLAGQQHLIRAGIRLLLEQARHFHVVGEAVDGREVRQLSGQLQPRVLVLCQDLAQAHLPELGGWLRVHCPRTVSLVLAGDMEDWQLSTVAASGVAGLVATEDPPKSLFCAIRRAARGEILYSWEQLARARRWQEEVDQRWQQLTGREREVVQLLACGRDNATIARELGVSNKTVAFHITNLLGKLGLASRLEAAIWLRDHLPQQGRAKSQDGIWTFS